MFKIHFKLNYKIDTNDCRPVSPYWRLLRTNLKEVRPMIRNTMLDTPDEFKLGLFSANCSGGLAVTKAPERWNNRPRIT